MEPGAGPQTIGILGVRLLRVQSFKNAFCLQKWFDMSSLVIKRDQNSFRLPRKLKFWLCQINAFSILKIFTSSPHKKTSSSRSLYFCHNAISCWSIVNKCFNRGMHLVCYLYSATSNLIRCSLDRWPVQGVSSKPVGALLSW